MLLGLHVGETTLGNIANRILSLRKGQSDASDGTIGQGLPGLPLLGEKKKRWKSGSFAALSGL